MKNEAAVNADADRLTRERVDKINEADGVIFQTEKQLKEYGDKIPADKKQAIETALENLKNAHKAQDLEQITKQLEAVSYTHLDVYKRQA